MYLKILLVAIMLYSCSTLNIDNRLKDNAVAIWDNPELLKDIKNNFPEFYNEEYINSNLMNKDYLDHQISDINLANSFCGWKKYRLTNTLKVRHLDQRNITYDLKNIIEFSIRKRDSHLIRFQYLKVSESAYYLLDVYSAEVSEL